MSDCKLITIHCNVIATSRKVGETLGSHPNFNTTAMDNPAFEKELNTYLKQGYKIVDRITLEPHYYSYLLVRD